MKEDTNLNIRVGFAEALTLLFIALKLCHVIAWSWWLVLLPLWIDLLVVAAVALIIFIKK